MLTIYEDRTFSFILKQPPAAELIKQAAGIEKGSGVPNRDKVASLRKNPDYYLPGFPRVDRIDIARIPDTGTSYSAFRAKQLWHWIYHRGETDFEKMTSLAKPFRAALAERFEVGRPGVTVDRQSIDGTRKSTSGPGCGLNTIVDFELVSRMIMLASSKLVIVPCGFPRLKA